MAFGEDTDRLRAAIGRFSPAQEGSPAIFIALGSMDILSRGRDSGSPEGSSFPADSLKRLRKTYKLYMISPPGNEPERVALDRFAPPAEIQISGWLSSVNEIDRAAVAHGINRGRSFFLGTNPAEIEAAWKRKVFGLFLLSGEGGIHVERLHGDIPVFHSFSQAVDWILRDASPLETLGREILRGAEVLKEGGVVAFPTETVYGLGADAFNTQGVEKIFRLKRRPKFNPLIVHLGSLDQVDLLAASPSPAARRLMEAFWPGPLTLVLPKRREVPDVTTGGNATVAVRLPKHPVAQALLGEAGLTVAAPSANLFGRISPTTAAHVREQLGRDGYEIIDGGACRVGVESSVLSLTGPIPVLLRPGGIPLEELEAVAGPIDRLGKTENPAFTPLQSPGLLAVHYAPKTPLRIAETLPRENEDPQVGMVLLRREDCRSAGPVEVLSAKGGLAEAAVNLYAALRRLDEGQLREIVVPRFPDSGMGRALNDRLQKAARGGEQQGHADGEGGGVNRKVKWELPELLAPAGTLEAAITAYKYGADAVYAGLGRFNAREMGENFSFNDMSRLSAYAKKLGKRFYLTLNTLVKETELPELFVFLDRVDRLEPDALIVQDIGVFDLLKRYYPHWELHGSTQMGIHNSAGLSLAGRMGFSRVILERQVSLKEAKILIASSPVEVEVFVHGSLCCGLSGHCLFSSWIGGWSGNRGRCKQPCRRRYHGFSGKEKKGGFFFSPRDLYTLDLLGELKEAGTASLKIEGRLKKPDYVRRVVTAYRMVLDAPPGEENQVLGEARNILSGSFGRRWSHGFYLEEELPSLIQHDSPGVSGQFVGRVGLVTPRGFAMDPARRLSLEDQLRIQTRNGGEGPTLRVTKMTRGGRLTKAANKGETIFIHCDKEIPRGGGVYRVGLGRKEELPDLAKLPLHKAPRRVSLRIRLDETGMEAMVTGLPGGALEIRRFWPGPPDEAAARPMTAEGLESLFRASRNPLLKAGSVEVSVEGDWFLPMSLQKNRRREFWELIEARLSPEAPPIDFSGAARMTLYKEDLTLGGEMKKTPCPRRLTLAEGAEVPDRWLGERITSHAYESWALGRVEPSEDDEIVLPHFCPEGGLKALQEGVETLKKAGIWRFRLTSLYQLTFFQGKNGGGDSSGSPWELTAAYPLAVTNAAASRLLNRWGVSRIQGWLELEEESLEALAESSPLPMELYQRGRPFLLATRASLGLEGVITDPRGKGIPGGTLAGWESLLSLPPGVLGITPHCPSEGRLDLYRQGGGPPGGTPFNFYKSLI